MKSWAGKTFLQIHVVSGPAWAMSNKKFRHEAQDIHTQHCWISTIGDARKTAFCHVLCAEPTAVTNYGSAQNRLPPDYRPSDGHADACKDKTEGWQVHVSPQLSLAENENQRVELFRSSFPILSKNVKGSDNRSRHDASL